MAGQTGKIGSGRLDLDRTVQIRLDLDLISSVAFGLDGSDPKGVRGGGAARRRPSSAAALRGSSEASGREWAEWPRRWQGESWAARAVRGKESLGCLRLGRPGGESGLGPVAEFWAGLV